MEKQQPPSTPPPGTHTLDERLDEALEETFPASDPVSIHIDGERQPGQPRDDSSR